MRPIRAGCQCPGSRSPAPMCRRCYEEPPTTGTPSPSPSLLVLSCISGMTTDTAYHAGAELVAGSADGTSAHWTLTAAASASAGAFITSASGTATCSRWRRAIGSSRTVQYTRTRSEIRFSPRCDLTRDCSSPTSPPGGRTGSCASRETLPRSSGGLRRRAPSLRIRRDRGLDPRASCQASGAVGDVLAALPCVASKALPPRQTPQTSERALLMQWPTAFMRLFPAARLRA
jgi:hypothetical protein